MVSSSLHVRESTGKVQKAIELNLKGYQIRLVEVPARGGLLGGFEQNIGYNYNTANDHATSPDVV